MAKAWHIRDWEGLYEVSDKGRDYSPGGTHKLRESPLDYVKWRVNGRDQGEGFRTLRVVAGTDLRHLCAFGVFGKLLEIAADNPARLRGWIVNGQGRPLDARMIADFCSFPHKAVTDSLKILCDERLTWLEFAEFPEQSGTVRENPGESGSLTCKEKEREKEHEGVHEEETRVRAGADFDKQEPSKNEEPPVSPSPDKPLSSPLPSSLSPEAQERAAREFARPLGALLGIEVRNADKGQRQADFTTVFRIARAAMTCRPDQLRSLLTDLSEIAKTTGADPKLKNRISRFVYLAKLTLKKRGIQWQAKGGAECST